MYRIKLWIPGLNNIGFGEGITVGSISFLSPQDAVKQAESLEDKLRETGFNYLVAVVHTDDVQLSFPEA